MPTNAQQIGERSIFLQALEQRGPNEQAAFLDTACAGDPALRQRVEALLHSHNQAGSFFGKLAPERLAEDLAAETAGLQQDVASTNGLAGVGLNFLARSENPNSLGRLGSYEIQEVIGRGGMGIVLRAFDEKLHRVVAIKVMTTPLATNATARKRFTREARSAAAVSHDHVVTIHGVEETSDLPYLVMQYVSGVSLQERLDRNGPLQLHEILRIGMQAATGLAAAHAQGLVHRDIKPANILLENGVERVKITDFGLAHAVDDVRTTQPGTVVGTPEYMSPEQARGEKVDHRSDLFSLGCVLYAMSAGRPPFRAESTVAIIRRVCEDVPRPLVEINPEIPEWLVDLIDKLIAKDASERFQSAAEVADLLGQYLAHVQQPAVNPEPVAIMKLRSARGQNTANGRSRWSIAAAAVLLLCAGLSLAESTGVTTVAATVIRIVRGDGTLVVEVDDPNIQVLVDGEELVISGAGPKEIRLRPGQHELHTAKDGKPLDTKLITITRDGRQVVKVAREEPTATAPSPPITRLAWADAADTSGDVSPDGRYLSFVDWETGDLAVRDLATGMNRRLTNKGLWSESSEFAMSPKFSADGMQLAYTWYDKAGKATLRVVGAQGGDPHVVSSDKESPEPYGWSPDGKWILAALYPSRERMEIASVGVTDGAVRIIKTLDDWRVSKVGHLKLAPDGQTIAYSRGVEPKSANHDIFLIDVATGKETQLTTHAADKRVLAWAPDGQRLLFDMERQGARDAWLIRIIRGQPQGEAELVKKDLGVVVPQGFTRDGALYYGTSSRGPSLFTATVDLVKGSATAAPLALEKFNISDRFRLGDWSPDGESLAYWARSRVTEELRIASLKTGQIRVLKPDLRNLATRFRWSPDGRSFLFQNIGLAVFQVDAVSGEVTTVLERSSGRQPIWSRDGRGIFHVARPMGQSIRIVHRDLETGTETEVPLPGNLVSRRSNFWFELSPDGRQLALLGEPNSDSMGLWLITLDNGESRQLLKVDTPGTLAGGVGWTPDGAYVLYTQLGGDESQRGLWYIPASGGQPRKIALSGVDAKSVSRFAMHPDGKQLAITVEGTGKSEVWAMENFLPPLDDSKPPAADVSAAKGKSAASADNAAPAAVREQPAPTGPSTRQVWANTADAFFSGAPSPDGKYLAYKDAKSGNVTVRELATGKSHALTNRSAPEYGDFPIFSPDNREVAFSWVRKDEVTELRTIGIDGTGLRVVYANQEKETQSLWPHDWSADRKSILATFATQISRQIVLTAVADGSTRVLKTVHRGSPGKMRLSPDGRYVAYSMRQPENSSRGRDIFLLATDGSGDVTLIEHPADDTVLGFAHDGKRLLFASDRTGSTGIWTIGIVDGKPDGAAKLVQPEMGEFKPLGVTRNGSFFYGLSSGKWNVYTATLDLEKGQLLSPPAEPMQHGEGTNWAPAWSPDGRYLACVSHPRGNAPVFYIRSVESKEVRKLAPNLRSINVLSLHWSPDSRAPPCAGLITDGRYGAVRVDVQTGVATTLLANDASDYRSAPFDPILSPDGKSLFFQRYGEGRLRRILQQNRETGVEKELYAATDRSFQSVTLSPDGQQLAFTESGKLKLLPTAGGELRELMKGEGSVSSVAWTPDGRHLLVQRQVPGNPDGEASRRELWRVPAGGGEPQKLEVSLPNMPHLRIHADGRQIAFSARSPETDKSEIWALENFLPSLNEDQADKRSGATATNKQ